MKRIISLCCVCLILFMSLAVPARAVDFDNFIQVLDYGYPNDSSTTFVSVFSSDQDIFFYVPETVIRYVDILCTVTGVHPSSVTYLPQGLSAYGSQLTSEYLGDNIFRFYGYVNSSYSVTNFSLRFNTSESYVDFKSVRILTSPFDDFTVGFEATGFYPGGSIDLSKNWGDNRPTSLQIIHDGASFDDRDFVLYLSPKDWQKYDWIDYQLSLIVSDITSVSCVMGNINVPLDVSYTQFSNSDSMYYLTISFDVSDLDRTSDDYPMVIIEGHVVFSGVSSIMLINSKGYVNLNQKSYLSVLFDRLMSWIYDVNNSVRSGFFNVDLWIRNQSALIQSEFTAFTASISAHFSNLNSWISAEIATIQNEFSFLRYYLEVWFSDQTDRLEAAIRGDTDPGDDFQDQVDQKDQELEDMAAVMDSVTKPDIQDINVSVDQYVKPSDVQVLATPLTVFFEADLFRSMIIMSILLATVSFTLYGKR